jgi:hypothetical protein
MPRSMARRDNDLLVMNIIDSRADLKVRLYIYDLTFASPGRT